MLKNNIFTFKYGNNEIKLESNIIARQSTSSLMASMGDTVIIVSLVCNTEINNEKSFLPLSVHYQEKFYSAGKIPGSFFRREGRSSDIEIITSRLIDRAIRPLFNENILNDIQIVVNVISVDPQITADILSIIAVSAVLSISGIPNIEILGAARIAYINKKFILNPTLSQINCSELDLVIAGTKDGITVIDASCNNLSEKKILDAISFGFLKYQKIIDNIKLFSKKNYINNFTDLDFSYLNYSLCNDLKNFINIFCKKEIKKIYFSNLSKQERLRNIDFLIKNLLLNLKNNNYEVKDYLVINQFYKIEKKIIISHLLKYGFRIDGRLPDEIRNIDIKVGFLPKRVHGSALFTRGETQALVTITLGTSKDAQNFNDIYFGDRIDKFIFHYNFPPYSVGEIGNIGIPKRREIGHGYLAKKGIIPVLPTNNEFPYTIRIVSDILESNGSSSMASVCGASLALIDAGVPIKYVVAGVAMGLLKHKNKIFVLSDIIGDEDRLGDMDFKIIGTIKGITALQMDMKVKGIDCKIINYALVKAKKARMYILDKINNSLNNINNKLSPFAPKINIFKIGINQIKDVIGKRGSVIKGLTEKYNCLIEIENDGTIKIISYNDKDVNNVINDIKSIIEIIKVGSIYKVKIIKIVNFGIFVLFKNGKEGLVHISQIFNNKNEINNIFNYFKIGQFIYVKVLDITFNGKIKLKIHNNFKK